MIEGGATGKFPRWLRSTDPLLATLVLAISGVITVLFASLALPTILGDHTLRVSGEAPFPFRYRILVPIAVEGLHALTGVGLGPVYIAVHAAALFAALWIYLATLRRFFGVAASLLGATILAVYYAATLTLARPEEPVALLLFVAFARVQAMTANLWTRRISSYSLIAVGTFVKELTLALAAGLVLVEFRRCWPQARGRFLALGGLALSAYLVPSALLRAAYGTGTFHQRFADGLCPAWVEAPCERAVTLLVGSHHTPLLGNLQPVSLLMLALFFNVLPLTYVRNRSSIPEPFTVLATASLIYLGFVFFVGNLMEPRILVPALVGIVPGLLITLEGKKGPPTRSSYVSGRADPEL